MSSDELFYDLMNELDSAYDKIDYVIDELRGMGMSVEADQIYLCGTCCCDGVDSRGKYLAHAHSGSSV